MTETVVSDDFLCEPAHLWICAIQQLCPCHVNCRLMMREHQPHKIHVAAARAFDGRRGGMHPLHGRVEVRPISIGSCPVVHLRRRLTDRRTRRHFVVTSGEDYCQSNGAQDRV